jgi:hypothetical protein
LNSDNQDYQQQGGVPSYYVWQLVIEALEKAILHERLPMGMIVHL